MDIGDIGNIAGQAVDLIKPYLGVLMKAGVGALGKDLGKDTAEKVRTVWTKIEPEIGRHPQLHSAADELISEPDDPDNVAVLRKALKKRLANNQDLALELREILSQRGGLSTHDSYSDIKVDNSPHAHIGPDFRGS